MYICMYEAIATGRESVGADYTLEAKHTFSPLPDFYYASAPIACNNLINLNNNEYICHIAVVTTIEGQHHRNVEQRCVLKLIW